MLAAEVRALSPRVWVVTLYSRALYSQLELENEDYLLIVHKIAMKEAAYKGKLRKKRSERSAKQTSSPGRTMCVPQYVPTWTLWNSFGTGMTSASRALYFRRGPAYLVYWGALFRKQHRLSRLREAQQLG